MDYPRYKPDRQRAAGQGAFSDYAAFVLRVGLQRLKSCRIDRRARARAVSARKQAQAA